MITKEQVQTLSIETILHNVHRTGSDKKPIRCRVNGKCKTWKTRPLDFRLPVKAGLYAYGYITQRNNAEWSVPCPHCDSITHPVGCCAQDGHGG